MLQRFKNSIVKHDSGGDPSPSELHQQLPRKSYSSQSSSCASPLTRVEGSSSGHRRERRLSPSRLSGGSFDVAVNYGMATSPPINNQLLSIYLPNMSSNKKTAPPNALSPNGNGGTCDPSMSIASPFTSSPTTPSSPPEGKSLLESSIVVQVHEAT